MDTVDKQTRSNIMRSVGRQGTSPELKLRKALYHLGFRYILNDKRLPGSPDLVFRKYNAVIFVHGCFWHRHGCKYTTMPATRKQFWEAKFKANKERDQQNYNDLLTIGWRVLVVWECAIKMSKGAKFDNLCLQVSNWLKSDEGYKEIGDI